MKIVVREGKILENTPLSKDVCFMKINVPEVAALAEAGQFVMVKNERGGTFLRRPFGIADVDKGAGNITIFYRLVGKGTKEYLSLKQGDVISVEGPLGSGFDFSQDKGRTLIIGGGVGIAPMLYTAKAIAQAKEDCKPVFLLGIRNAGELFWQEYLQESTEELVITTDDGSAGIKGFAINAIPEILEKHKDIKHIKICGPTIMMEGIAKLAMEKGLECQVSLEKRMACGIGVCLGCTFEGKVSGKRWKICHDGPVFPAEEVFEK